ncbi:hypothetical protein LXL04_003170 [Taraxacum kok-saghyz]
MPKETEKIKNPFARRLASRIERLPVFYKMPRRTMIKCAFAETCEIVECVVVSKEISQMVLGMALMKLLSLQLLKLKVPPTPSEEKCDCTPAPPPAEENVTEPPPAATEETTTETLETTPGDYRFPTTNQSRHCFTRYVEYHRSVFNQFKTNF